MAEQKGFFRRIFSFGSDSEADRTPEHGDTPRPSDTEMGAADSPDPDVRPTAAASSVADSEAGADAGVDDGGGITPLAETAHHPEADPAQKKTPDSRRS
ncbi:hypothetical protein VQ042_15735 [Aurantimonas sp. A2-1-M11]|uniref:hypothetical protein n=1 Tax=Aurantimonas sp. A2-1-M11 TaxID=3113712 RepID=UPI002F947D4B